MAFVGLILLWEASVRLFEIPLYLLPAPSRIWNDTLGIGGLLWSHTFATLKIVLIGFVLSMLLSIPLAVAIASSALISNTLYPILVLTQAVPKVALAPILVVALGANELPRIVVTFLIAFFPLVIATATGLLSVPGDLIELGRSSRASWFQELRYIRMPYSIPFIFGGLKVAVTLSVVGAVVGEFVSANQGLGYLITSSMAFFRTPVAFGAMIILALIGVVLFQMVVLVERIFFPWSSSNQTPAG